MADERYVIDIIINARDSVADAVSRSLSGLGELDKAADRSRNRMREFGAEADRASDRIRGGINRSLKDLQTELGAGATAAEQHTKSIHKNAEELRHSEAIYEDYNRDLEQQHKLLQRSEEDMAKLNRALDDNRRRLESGGPGGRALKENGEAWKRVSAEMERHEKLLDRLKSRHDERTKAFEEQSVAVADLGDQVNKANEAFDSHIVKLEKNRTEIEKQGRAYERAIQQVIRAREEFDKARATAGVDRTGLVEFERELDRSQKSVEHHFNEINRLAQEGAMMKLGMDASEFQRKAAATGLIKEALVRDETINIDVDMGTATAKLGALEAMKAKAGRDIDIDVDVDANNAFAMLQRLAMTTERNRASIAAFDNQIRGLLAFGVVALFQPLLSAVVALAAELVALASSAVMAGSALGGALVVGIAQATPAVGLLVAAFVQVAGVIEAVQQQELMRKQAFAEGLEGDTQAASSLNTLKNAHDAVRDAQINLTRARFEARRQLQDLILAEREAEVAARSAALTQEEAQRSLQRAITGGDIAGVGAAQLDVVSSGLASRRAEMEARRARQDLSLQRRGAVTAPDRSVEQAQQTLEQAQRSLENARRTSAQAADDLTSAGAHLRFFLSQLSEAERGLYEAILRLKRAWNQNMVPITDQFMESFTFAVDRVTKILKNPSFLAAADGLADAMTNQMDRITREFTSPKWIGFWNKMMDEAARNVKPITETFLQLADVFRRIALAARPVFRVMIDLIGEAVDDFDKFVGRGKSLNEFFDEATKHFEAWWDLGRAVLRLFVELIDSGAKEGLNTVRDATEEINKAAKWIDTHNKQMDEFWEDTRRIMASLASVFLALGEEIIKAFDADTVEALGRVTENVLIPAFGEAIRLLGQFVVILDKITQNEAAATLLKLAIAATIANRVFRTFAGMVTGFIGGIAKVAAGVGRLGEGFTKLGNWFTRTFPGIAQSVAQAGGWARAFGMVALRVTGLAGAFVFLAAKFGVLDDIWDGIKTFGSNIIREVGPAVEELVDAFRELFDLFDDGGGKLKPLIDVFRFFFVNFIQKAAIPAIEELGTIIGKILGGPIKILAGAIKLDFGLIAEGIKDVFEGMVRTITMPFRIAFGIVKDILGGFINWAAGIGDKLLSPFEFVADAIVTVFEDIRSPLIDVLNFIIDEIINRIPGVQLDLIEDPGETARTRRRNRRAGRRAAQTGFAEFHAEGGRVGMQGGGVPPGVTPITTGGAVAKNVGDLLGLFGDIDFDFLPDWMKGLGAYIINKGKDAVRGMWEGGTGWIPDVTPWEGLSPFAFGGRAEGPGGVDTIPAWLTRKEFVVTPDGEGILEAVTGVPGILNWLAGVQRRATGFAFGGRVGMQEGGRPRGRDVVAPPPSDTGPLFDQVMAMLAQFGENAIDSWKKIWDQIESITQTITKNIARITDRNFDDLQKDINKSLRKTSSNVDQWMKEMRKSVTQGMNFILEQTNRALEAFGVDKINLSVSKGGGDGEKKAEGGFVGKPGERGRDTISTVLGRGEAVLNWGAQAVMNALLPGQETVATVLGRMGGYHAGGPEQPGFAGGYAGERFPGGGVSTAIPGFPGEFINSKVLKEALYFIRKYKLFITDAFATSGHSGAGHLVTGTAMDAVPGGGGSWALVGRAVADAVRRGLTVLYDGQFGSVAYPDHGEGHHAHFELADGAAGESLKGAFARERIKSPKVMGVGGRIKDLVQTSLDEVRKAAQKYVSKKSMGLGRHEYEGGEMSEGEVRRVINQAMNLVGVPKGLRGEWMQMALARAFQESGFDPNVTNTWDSNAAAGTPSIGLFQTIEPTFRAHMMRGMNDITNPLHNAVAAFRYMLDQYGHGDWAVALQTMQGISGGYALGGEIPGPEGAPQGVIAHAGEWVLNRLQQSKIAGLLGTTTSALRDFMGFSGGPVGYQGGGEVDQWMTDFFRKFGDRFIEEFQKIFSRVGTRVPIGGAVGLMGDVEQLAGSGMRMFRRTEKDLNDAIRQFFSDIAGEGGYLDQFTTAIEGLLAQMQTNLNRAIVRTNRRGQVIGRDLQSGQILDRELSMMQRELRLLLGQRGIIATAMRQAQQALRLARRRGDDDAEQTAEAAVQNLLERQRAINAAVAEAQLAIMDKMEERMAARVERINRETERQLTGAFNRARRFGVEIRRRIAEALGQLDRIPELAQAQIDILEEQQERLRRALRRARRRGDRELARELEDQIADLEATIAESTMEIFALAQEQIETQAGRRQVQIDFAQAIADLTSGMGGTVQGAQMSVQALQAQQGSIQTQIAQMQGLLAQAIAMGAGEGVIGPLQDEIVTLQAELVNNSLALYEATIAVRQAAIDIITNQQSFLGGVSDALTGIVQTMGEITGVINLPLMVQLAQQAITQLQATGQALIQQMVAFAHENALPPHVVAALQGLAGLHGQDFVTAIMGMDLNAIVASLGGPASPLAQQFQALLQAIIDNEAALQSNTQQLQEIQQQNNIQQFTSTAWQWFREAIFTGMGGLIPQYAAGVPFFAEQAASGSQSAMASRMAGMRSGSIGSSLAKRPMPVNGKGPTTSNQEINVYGVPTDDAVATAGRIAFEAKIPRT